MFTVRSSETDTPATSYVASISTVLGQLVSRLEKTVFFSFSPEPGP